MEKPSRAERIANGVFVVAGALKRLVPERVRKAADDRFFYAVFNLTRVTNDDYVSEEIRERREAATRPTPRRS